jgi:hypothetical protein
MAAAADTALPSVLQEVQREAVAVSDGREQLPLSDCPGNCSYRGACTRAAGTVEAPACRCLWRYTVS